MEYGVLGPAVTQTMGAEGAASGPGQLIVNEATAQRLGDDFTLLDQAPGYYSIQRIEDQEVGDFEIKAEERRARSSVPWNASPHALLAQMRVALNQIHALEPYLAAELAERVIVHARDRRVESEFLLTTVLFCNFIGFETLYDAWGRAGVQRLTSLLSAYFAAMNEAVARYGGIVTRIDPYSNGTKLLAVFGAPVSHEDDPQRAVSAALAMNAELEALNERWRQKFTRYIPADWEGPLIKHRIGITQGNVYAGMVGSSTRREYTVMGDDVNLSARLMGAAKPGQILISQRIFQSVADYFLLTEAPPIRVKASAPSLHQVDGRATTPWRPVPKRPPLVGRKPSWRGKQFLQRLPGKAFT
jgi:class 3 adenylate cyclase